MIGATLILVDPVRASRINLIAAIKARIQTIRIDHMAGIMARIQTTHIDHMAGITVPVISLTIIIAPTVIPVLTTGVITVIIPVTENITSLTDPTVIALTRTRITLMGTTGMATPSRFTSLSKSAGNM